jgi:dTDP-4-amino-4,6-dideoxygalactose transaminase
MGEYQAAILLRQLDRLDAIADSRRRLYGRLREALVGAASVALPPDLSGDDAVPARFPVRVEGDKFAFYDRCVRLGLDLGFSFTYIESPRECERAHALARSDLNIPFHSGMTDRLAAKAARIILEADGGAADAL